MGIGNFNSGSSRVELTVKEKEERFKEAYNKLLGQKSSLLFNSGEMDDNFRELTRYQNFRKDLDVEKINELRRWRDDEVNAASAWEDFDNVGKPASYLNYEGGEKELSHFWSKDDLLDGYVKLPYNWMLNAKQTELNPNEMVSKVKDALSKVESVWKNSQEEKVDFGVVFEAVLSGQEVREVNDGGCTIS